MDDITNFIKEYSREVKSKLVIYAKNPLYVGLFILFALSGGSSVYILFASQSMPTPTPTLTTLSSSGVTTLPTPTITFLPTTAPTPTTGFLPTTAPTPSTTSITAGWNTYTNTTYAYSIQYPNDWVASDSGKLEPLIPSYIIFNPATTAPSTRTITISYTTRTMDQLAAIYGTTSQPLTIDALPAAEYVEKDSDGNQTISVILPVGLNALIFTAVAQSQGVLLQMLQTFQLTN